MDFWKRKIVTTRKDHVCAFCGGIIPAKAKAEYNTGNYEDAFQWYYLCIRCLKAIDEWQIDLSEGFQDTDFKDYAHRSEKAKCPACGSWKASRNWDNKLLSCVFQCKVCKTKWTADFSFKEGIL